jgi:hypothetical protein
MWQTHLTYVHLLVLLRELKYLYLYLMCLHASKWPKSMTAVWWWIARTAKINFEKIDSFWFLVNSCIYSWGLGTDFVYCPIYLLFIYLFNDLNYLRISSSGSFMKGKECSRKQLWPNLSKCPGIFLEGFRKTTNNLRIMNVPVAIRIRIQIIIVIAKVKRLAILYFLFAWYWSLRKGALTELHRPMRACGEVACW